MGLFDLLFGKKKKETYSKHLVDNLIIDLSKLSFNNTKVGTPFSSSDPICDAFKTGDVYKPQGEGIEVGVKDGLFDFIFITLQEFYGQIKHNGTKSLSGKSVNEIIKEFGKPYWTDRDDDETILFYEYDNGRIEVQFEFDTDGKFIHLMITKDGVLSKEEQRQAYGVDKAWPPQD